MNKIIKITACLAVVLGAISCDKFLTEDPKSQIEEKEVWSDAENAAGGVTACYSRMADGVHYGTSFTRNMMMSSIFGTTGSNVSTAGGTGIEVLRIGTWRYDVNNKALDDAWRGVYQSIYTINETITRINASPTISQEDKDRLSAEVRFLRGICFFDVVRVYGRAPLYLEHPGHGNYQATNRPRSSVNDIFDAVIADFEFAFQYMMDKNDPRRHKSRPHKWAAKVMLAEVYAHLATNDYLFLDDPSKDPYVAGRANNEYWQKAYDYAMEVYHAKVYSLHPDYDRLWRCQDENTDEAVFEINNMIQVGGTGFAPETHPQFHPVFLTKQISTSNHPRIRPTKVIYEWHKTRYSLMDEDGNTVSIDPRLNSTYITGRYKRNDTQGNQNIYPLTGGTHIAELRFPGLIKYLDPNHRNGNNTDTNLIYYRYAALLMLIAECANELGDPDGIKFKVVNEVLARARSSTLLQLSTGEGNNPGGSLLVTDPNVEQLEPADWASDDPRFNTMEGFREELFRERLCEMPMELYTWHDVRRRGIEWFTKWALAYNGSLSNYVLRVEENDAYIRYHDLLVCTAPTHPDVVRKFLLMPIPIKELTLNHALTLDDQNFGYSKLIEGE